MKNTLCIAAVLAILSLAACQMNNVRDTGGGAVSPSSTATGVQLNGLGSNNQ